MLEQNREVDFIAELNYYTPEQGGRSTPTTSGYRPGLKFEFAEMQTSGRQIFIDKEIVYPGDTVTAEIKIVSVDFFANKLIEDMSFDFREGPKIIGTGKIIQILNPKLKYINKENIDYLKTLNWTFQKWSTSPALIDKSGFPSHQYLGQIFDPNYFTINPQGWTHDHCEICSKILCETNEECETSGYVSDNQWLCISCFNSFINENKSLKASS